MSELDKVIQFFSESSERDLEVAHQLYDTEKYSYSLFFCHLALEKLFKAIIVKRTNEHPPFSHNLVRLAELAKLPVDKDTVLALDEMTKFNISARYDDEKLAFYNQATREFTDKYIEISEKIHSWLKNYLTE